MALNQIALIPPQTAAKTVQYDATDVDSVIVAADNLAGAEVITLQVMAGSTGKQVTDIYAVAINLTATLSAVALEGGGIYQFVKPVTAGACGVYVGVKET